MGRIANVETIKVRIDLSHDMKNGEGIGQLPRPDRGSGRVSHSYVRKGGERMVGGSALGFRDASAPSWVHLHAEKKCRGGLRRVRIRCGISTKRIW